MNFINSLDDNSILIVPNNIKTKVLTFINDNSILKSLKIMSFVAVKKALLFDYKTDAIKATMDYMDVSFGVAKSYIGNLYYVNEEEYINDKMNTLLDLKKYLTKNNYLKFDSLFKELLKSKSKVYVYGYDYINLFNRFILDKIKEYTEVEIIEKNYMDYEHTIYEFNSMFEECSFVFEKILELIDDGVQLDKIFITNYNRDYTFTFKTLINLTNLPIYLKSNTTLYDTSIGSYFLNNLTNNIDSLMYKIKKKFDVANSYENEKFFNNLSNMINDYYWCENNYTSIKEIIENDMKSRIIPNRHFNEEILTTNIIDNVFDDDEYVFLIGFNLGEVPRLKRDEDYISDDIKPYYLETTDVYNRVIKETYLKAIKNIKNLTITYKLGTRFKSCEKSFLANDSSFKIKKKRCIISNYSDDLNVLNMSKLLDNLIKFNTHDKYLDTLFSSYKPNYKTYHNEFTSINTEKLISNINDKLVFSYSNISDYYKCPFKFYVKHILKIKAYKTVLSQFIGSLFHYVLERGLDGKEDIDEVFEEYVCEHYKDIDDTYKNKFFINNLKKEIKFLVSTIKEQHSHSKHDKTMLEHEIVIDVERKIKTKIKGFVDKILMLENSALIVDYKTTNNQAIDTNLFEFGLSTQLPIYLYLLKAVNKDIEIAGIYIQHILALDEVYDPDKDLIEEKKKNLKLEGITFDNIDLISKFDDTYEKSQVIKSLSVTKNGVLKKNKNILSIEKRDELVNIMENLIVSCIDNVCEGNFSISPIKIEKIVDGCDFCEYKDICFRKFKDFNIQHIKSKEDEESE